MSLMKILFQPNRIYYLEDPDGYALEWCKAIDEVKAHYYPSLQDS
jgi:3-phosphoinositide dependent protein kinase-1